jgi:uncharacterized protein
MKFLLIIVVVIVAAWLLLGRRGPGKGAGKNADAKAAPKKAAAQTMLACSHCGVHLPEAEALRDGSGRPFCTEAHRLAGPR